MTEDQLEARLLNIENKLEFILDQDYYKKIHIDNFIDLIKSVIKVIEEQKEQLRRTHT